ncbi:unnamed protein product, partial [Prorocentrum cordatum]
EMEAAQLETIIERTAIRAAEKTEETVLVQIKKLAVTVARDTCREMSTELDTRMEELGSNASLFGGSTGSTAGSVHGGAGGGSFDYGGDNRMRHVAGSVDITGFVEDWKAAKFYNAVGTLNLPKVQLKPDYSKIGALRQPSGEWVKDPTGHANLLAQAFSDKFHLLDREYNECSRTRSVEATWDTGLAAALSAEGAESVLRALREGSAADPDLLPTRI